MTLPRLLAEWSHDPGCSCSRTSLGCCLRMAGTLWSVSFRDWPRSATWDATGFYELPTPRHLTAVSDGSAPPGLLPTPEASDGTGGRVAAEMGGKRPSGSKRAITVSTAVAHMLKTPTAQLAVNGGSQHPDKRREGGHGPTLADQVEHLLPTPRSARNNDSPQRPDFSPSLGMVAQTLNLLPTPSVADVTGGHRYRSGDRRDELLLPGVAEALSTGGLTPPPSPAGSESPDAQHPAQLSLDGPESA